MERRVNLSITVIIVAAVRIIKVKNNNRSRCVMIIKVKNTNIINAKNTEIISVKCIEDER